MKKIVVLTGAGISAESGIRTFRDADGLWEGHDVMEVASPEGWASNRELVLEFYNQRRKQALTAQPNQGHFTLAELEEDFEVTIVTQNVDNLHEKAGSSNVIHLHGELFKSQSTIDPSLVYDMSGWELNLGDKCEKESQLRPYIVWFGELVPMMDVAIEEALSADIFMVVGTSLVVYPAAGLIHQTRPDTPKYIIDPSMPDLASDPCLHLFEEKGSTGVPKVAQILREKYL
ncbi:NAD-dependent deacylase [Reichenbachiella carrageenanivorans]|uniref:NAD-dependent protein deacylase n=1 Tax=Reichenbachiella carrageenanivorans TaxID=2979869 RepID=A0ABY6CVU1_9BACT|nr:NAD-dependent deacylase [Reichenbachiella carrageenanivorans]UXX77978.1 NAD-dependent deacylase [Reichenbachiella carrageenanivorans]